MKLLYIPVLLLGLSNSVSALWPQPRSLQTGTTFVKLSPGFDIQFSGLGAPRDLQEAISRSEARLRSDKHQRLIVGRGGVDRSKVKSARSLSKLTLSLVPSSGPAKSIFDEATKEVGTRKEQYTLKVPANGGVATLIANSTLGLFRGLTTFEQLFYYDGQGSIYTHQAPVTIEDSPAYPYRGLMLDTARNFFPVSDIKRTLDAMSYVKINQFHWHVVDAQSFPLTIPGFPELTQKGAYSPEEVYSSADVQEIVKYAGARGIDVLMEVDTPGHTAIIAESHPDHVACAVASPWQDYAAEPPAGQLRIASPETSKFTAKLLANIAKTLPSKLFSTGGDEINLKCYADDAKTQADLAKTGRTLEQALGDFTGESHKALADIGKTPVIWQDFVISHNMTLNPNTVVLVWLTSAHAAQVADKGYRFVHAPSDYFYLDCGHGGWLGDFNGNSWCDPFKTWQRAYSFDPQANITADKAHLVLGGQQLLWTEQSSPENLDSTVWPRAAASAEVFWTGKQPDGSPLDVRSALARLHDIRYRLVQRGIDAIALQPKWCALRENACNLDS